jgi:broad specificity phosphatase PhoE
MLDNKVDLIRGMADLSLSPKGMLEAIETAKAISNRGGLMGVSSSTRLRALQTAIELLHANPQASLIEVTPCLEPWHLGGFEGQPSEEVHKALRKYVDDPQCPVPGVGPMSKCPGESLQAFSLRCLPYLVQQACMNPKGYGKVDCCHYRNIKLFKAWLAGGCDEKHWTVDGDELLKEENAPPSSLWCIEFKNNKLVLRNEDIDLDEPLDDYYLLRHGPTAFNKENSSSGSKAGGS